MKFIILIGIINFFYNYLGIYYFNKNDYKNSKIYFEKTENSFIKQYNLGCSEFRLNNLELSEKHLKLATKSDDKVLKSYSYYNLGNVYYQKNDYQKAVLSYIEALKINPDFYEARYNLSYVLLKMKKQKEEEKEENKNNFQNSVSNKNNKNKKNQEQKQNSNMQYKNDLNEVEKKLKVEDYNFKKNMIMKEIEKNQNNNTKTRW